jgi:hypothetical protein
VSERSQLRYSKKGADKNKGKRESEASTMLLLCREASFIPGRVTCSFFILLKKKFPFRVFSAASIPYGLYGMRILLKRDSKDGGNTHII